MKWKNKGHEFDFIGNKFIGKPKVYIYGAKEIGRQVFEELDFLNCVEGFIDQNEEKRKNGFCGKNVYSIYDLKNKKDDYIIIVACRDTIEQALIRTLVFEGYKEGEDFFLYNSFVRFYLPIYAMYAHGKLKMNIFAPSITERCTLNCEACNHSVPYIKNPQNFDKNDVKNDLDIFFQNVDFVNNMDMVGGELFLHNDLYEIVEYAAKNYRKYCKKFQLVSNGTIIPTKELLDLMKQHNITMLMSDYRTGVPSIINKVEKFIEVCKESGVDFDIQPDEYWRDYAIGKAKLEFDSEDEKIRYFDYCNNFCRYIKDGKLYFCTTDRLAQRAGLTEIDELSYYDLKIDTPNRKMELLEFEYGFNERGYLNLCTKCGAAITVNIKIIPKAIQYKKNEQ